MSRYIDADLLMPNAEHKGRYDVVSAYDIANTPTADVRENQHGHWIKDGEYQYRCSNCGEHIQGDEDVTPDINKFCWNCGADMRGEEDE